MNDDKETQDILLKYKEIHDLVGHAGWKLVRVRLTEKVLDLQNAFNIESEDAHKMLVDLQARKMAAGILYDWLREVEGDAQTSVENKPALDKSYVVKL
jgi:hypothetical protein